MYRIICYYASILIGSVNLAFDRAKKVIDNAMNLV